MKFYQNFGLAKSDFVPVCGNWHARPTFQLPPFYLRHFATYMNWITGRLLLTHFPGHLEIHLFTIYSLVFSHYSNAPLMPKSSQYIRTLSVLAHIYSLRIRTNMAIHEMFAQFISSLNIGNMNKILRSINFFIYLILFRKSSIVFLWIKVINC